MSEGFVFQAQSSRSTHSCSSSSNHGPRLQLNPLGMLDSVTWHANRHPKATHQWLLMGRFKNPLACFILQPTGTRKATHQWLLMGVQACHMPALKPLKPCQTLQTLQTLKNLPNHSTADIGMPHPAANSHPEATHQWLLMGRLNNPLACFILQPTGTPRPHINGFLWAFQGQTAICAASLSCPKATSRKHFPAMLRKNQFRPFQRIWTWHASSCSQQPPRGHTSMASYGPLKQSLGMLHLCSQQAAPRPTSMR